jgi:hypothetical protein
VSDLSRAALALLATGMLGAVAMLVFLRACSWAEWDLLPASYCAKAQRMERRAGGVIRGSAAVSVFGLLLLAGGVAFS